MRYIKHNTIILLLLINAGLNLFSQPYYKTGDIINNTKYFRKKQEVNSIISVHNTEGKLVINMTCTLDRNFKQQPYHLILPIDSVLSYYRDRHSFHYQFEPGTGSRFNVNSIERRYTNITNRQVAAGIDIMCRKEIIIPGLYNSAPSYKGTAKVEILDGERHPFEVDHRSRIYLKGKHIVLLYYFDQPTMVDGKFIDYVVINIENSSKINKARYLSLPFFMITETITLPLDFLLSRMEK